MISKMCSRFSFISTSEALGEWFNIKAKDEILPRYNIAPSSEVLAIKDAPPKIEKARWGFIPQWAKDDKFKTINSRAESLDEKRMFAQAFQNQRCVIPADGFYEWTSAGGKKIPYRFTLKDDGIFGFAGIYDVWHDYIGFSIITTTPNELVRPIHDRMPVLLDKMAAIRWLIEPDKKLLKPFPSNQMKSFQVSAQLNSPKNEGPDLIKPVKSLLDF